MVTRARIDVEAQTPHECLSELDSAFMLLYASSITPTVYSSSSGLGTFTISGGTTASPGPIVPRDSEFVEEVIESFVTDLGAVSYKARRVMRFIDTSGGPEVPANRDPSGDPSVVGCAVTVQWGTPRAQSVQVIQCFGHPEANAWGVIYEEILRQGIEPEEWWSLTQGGQEIPPLRKMRDLPADAIVFDGVDEEEPTPASADTNT